MHNSIKRALKDSFKISKSYYFILIAKAIFDGISPMVAIYYSQVIINQLAARDPYESILRTVIISLILGFIILVMSGVLTFFDLYMHKNYISKIELLRNTKMIDMDYKYIENSDIIALRRKLAVFGFSSHYSIESLPQQIFLLVKSVITTGISILILSPIFISKTGTTLDSPLYILFFIVYLLLSYLSLRRYEEKMTAKMELFEERNYSVNLMINYVINTLYDVETGKEIRIYNLKKLFVDIIRKSIEAGEGTFVSYLNKERNTSLISTVAAQLGSLFLILFVAFKIINGDLGPGFLVSSVTALNMLLSSLPSALITLTSINANTSAIDAHYEYMDLENQSDAGSLPIEKRLDNDYELKVESLDFAFPGNEELTLKDINIEFENGKSYAIVGENGSGKTTFIKLLTRLYTPKDGEIKLNDININNYKATEYYSLFNIVFQDFSLFSFRLGETVATSKTYDSEKVLKVLEESDFKKRLDTMTHGLDTILSKSYDPHGINLSGGEKQKLAIARAVYKDGPIYILDEPTSALDPISEFEVYEQFNNITQDKTSIFISHRLSSCRFCDEILVFDHGSIVEKGNHETLIKQDGQYKRLWDAQAQYYQ